MTTTAARVDTAYIPVAAVSGLAREPRVRVVIRTAWTATDLESMSTRDRGVPLVPVLADGRSIVIGPLQHAGAPACLPCAEYARVTARMGAMAMDSHVRRGHIPPHLQDLVSSLTGHISAAAPGSVWIVDADRATVSSHRARPRHDGCPRCHPLPPDSADGASTPRTSGVPLDPESLRADPGMRSARPLRGALLDAAFGPVVEVDRSGRAALPLARARVADRRLDGEGGYGRSTTFRAAEDVAVFEALERITGMTPGRRESRLHASYQELGPEIALDPERLGRHDPAAEAHPEFTLAPYDPATVATWVWGHSYDRSGPLAVPEQAAYWGRPSQRGTGLVAESSNGCGLGASLEEAALFGLLEIIERDAFLLAWFARSPLARVHVPAEDPLIRSLAARVEMSGYDLVVLDGTSDLGPPVAIAVALHRDRRSPAPQAFFTAGAHPNPVAAIRAAIVELTVNVENAPTLARQSPDSFDRARLRRLRDDPARIESIADHVGVNALPESRAVYEPLLSGPGPRPWCEIWPTPLSLPADAGAALDTLRRRASRRGVDTVVVDQTPDWAARLGIHAARVVAPGALSLTFGHLYRRTLGISRLLTVPKLLGRSPDALVYERLPLDPHPFP